MKYLITEVLDLDTEEFILSEAFFARPDHQILQDRRKLEECYQQGKKWLVCPLCSQPLKIRGTPNLKDRIKGLHFWHITHESDCPYQDISRYSKADIERMKFHGQKEGKLHEALKSIIAKSLSCDPIFSNIAKEQTCYHKTNPAIHSRRPDVSAMFDGQEIVFEIQLATTFLSVVVERDMFYKENSIFIMWIFNELQHDERLQQLTKKDVIHANKINAFVVNEDTLRRSEEEHKFMLYCHYQEPMIDTEHLVIRNQWKAKEIAFRDLFLDRENYKLYFFDYDKRYAELLAQIKWYIPETDWRMQWRRIFPQEWQFLPIEDPETKEKFSPDLTTPKGTIIQFVSANIAEKIIKQWEKTIPHLIWIVQIPIKSVQKVKDVKKLAINYAYEQKLNNLNQKQIEVSHGELEKTDREIASNTDKLNHLQQKYTEQQQQIIQQHELLKEITSPDLVIANLSELQNVFEQYFTDSKNFRDETLASSYLYRIVKDIFREYQQILSQIETLREELLNIEKRLPFIEEILQNLRHLEWPLNTFRELPPKYLRDFSHYWKDIVFIKTWEKNNPKKIKTAATEKEFETVIKDNSYSFYIKNSVISSITERYSNERKIRLANQTNENKLVLWEKVKELYIKQKNEENERNIQFVQKKISTMTQEILGIEQLRREVLETEKTLNSQKALLQKQLESEEQILKQKKQEQINLLKKEWERELIKTQEDYPKEIVYPNKIPEIWKDSTHLVYFDFSSQLLQVITKNGEKCLYPVEILDFIDQIKKII